MRRQSYTRAQLAAMVVLAGCSGMRPAPPTAVAAQSVSSSEVGFVSQSQVDRGRATFAESCGECHATSEMRGEDFDWTWRRQTAWQLFKSVSETMPEDDPGGLETEVYTDVVAYILSLNGYAVGGGGLVAEESILRRIALGTTARRSPR